MGQIRDFDQTTPGESLQSLTTENTTLKHRVQQLTREHRTLQERLDGGSNLRFAEKRIGDLEVQILERHGVPPARAGSYFANSTNSGLATTTLGPVPMPKGPSTLTFAVTRANPVTLAATSMGKRRSRSLRVNDKV